MSQELATGTSLTQVDSANIKKLSDSLTSLMSTYSASAGTLIKEFDTHRFFTAVLEPTADTAIYSPGSDICFIYDTVLKDLWLVYNWVSSTSFKVVKVVG